MKLKKIMRYFLTDLEKMTYFEKDFILLSDLSQNVVLSKTLIKTDTFISF